MTSTKSGQLIDSFTLIADGREIAAEIRLMTADDGTEMLWHYEGDHLGFVCPARRCGLCDAILTEGSDFGAGACGPCIDQLVG